MRKSGLRSKLSVWPKYSGTDCRPSLASLVVTWHAWRVLFSSLVSMPANGSMTFPRAVVLRSINFHYNLEEDTMPGPEITSPGPEITSLKQPQGSTYKVDL